jgi:hypothetical protein
VTAAPGPLAYPSPADPPPPTPSPDLAPPSPIAELAPAGPAVTLAVGGDDWLPAEAPLPSSPDAPADDPSMPQAADAPASVGVAAVKEKTPSPVGPASAAEEARRPAERLEPETLELPVQLAAVFDVTEPQDPAIDPRPAEGSLPQRPYFDALGLLDDPTD